MWVPVLLATVPQRVSGDWLEYMLCARQFPEEKEIILLLLEHLTEIRPNIKKRTWPEESNDVEIEFEVRGSEVWLKQAWRQFLQPNLNTIDTRLLVMFTSHIFRAYAAQHSFRGLGAWDKLSASRAQIESSASGGPPDAFDLVIDMIREALLSTIMNQPQSADFFIQMWFYSECRLLRRLAVFGVAENSHWAPDKKLAWLLENELVYADGFKPEVFLLLKKSFGLASERLRAQAIVIATKGPDRGEQRAKDYGIYNILNWLKDSAPGCELTAEAFSSFTQAHPQFVPSEHPELDWWIGPMRMGGPSSPLSESEVLALSPDELCQRLSVAKRDDLIGPSREGLIREIQSAVSKNYPWSARLARKLISDKTWEKDLWGAMVWGWQGAELEEHEWKEVLTILLETPDVTTAAVYEACQMLGKGIEKDSHPIPISCLHLATQLAESLWSVCDVSYKGRPEESDDWLSVAINHPAGDLVLFFLRMISQLRKVKKDEWSGIPHQYKMFLTSVVKAESYSAHIGCVILASQVYFLFTSDRDWTAENVIPLFGFGNPKRAIQAWHGF